MSVTVSVRLITVFGPPGTAPLTTAEVERREFLAYANGWNDAMATVPPPQGRPALTLLEGGAVIPFPAGRRAEADDRPDNVVPDAGTRGEEPEGPRGPAGEGASETGEVAAPARPDVDRRPRFAEKSARSKSPTIPRIDRGPSRRQNRRDLLDY